MKNFILIPIANIAPANKANLPKRNAVATFNAAIAVAAPRIAILKLLKTFTIFPNAAPPRATKIKSKLKMMASKPSAIPLIMDPIICKPFGDSLNPSFIRLTLSLILPRLSVKG